MTHRDRQLTTTSAALPPFTHEVQGLGAQIGAEATFALVEAYGGRRIYIPKVLDPDNEVCHCIGLTAYQLLKAWVEDPTRNGGQHYKVPVAKRWLILVLHARGMSYGDIAHALRCGENMVWNTLAVRDLTNRQLTLFD